MSEEQQKQEQYTAENEAQEADTIFGDAPVQKAAAPAREGGMGKNTRILIAAVAVLVLLGGGLTAMLLSNRSTGTAEDSSQSESTETITLNQHDAADVVRAEIHNGEDFEVIPVAGDAETETAADSGSETASLQYTIKGYEDLTMDSDFLSTLVKNGCALEAKSLVEKDPADPGKYGLGDEGVTAVLHYGDGSTLTFEVGIENPMDSTEMYCSVDGSVYLVRSSLLSNYTNPMKSYVSTTVVEQPDTTPVVDSARISRKDMDSDLVLEYHYIDDGMLRGSGARYWMIEPVFSYVTVENSVDATSGIFGLMAKDVLTLRPTDADLAAAGLDDPFCTATIKSAEMGRDYVLKFGDTYEDEVDGTECRYAQLEGTDVIYGIDVSKAIWLTLTPDAVHFPTLMTATVWNINSLEVTCGDAHVEFEGKGSSKEDYICKKDGVDCDIDRFRDFYAALMNLESVGLKMGELPAGEPDAVIHLRADKEEEDYTLSFYRQSATTTLVARDGVVDCTIRTGCLDLIRKNIERFDDTSQDFVTSYQ